MLIFAMEETQIYQLVIMCTTNAATSITITTTVMATTITRTELSSFEQRELLLSLLLRYLLLVVDNLYFIN